MEPTEKEKNSLKQLIQIDGWKVLCKFLDNDIDSLTARISEDDGVKREETERRMLIEARQAFKRLRNYPEKLSEEKIDEGEDDNYDPYDKHPNESDTK